ncbi:hypothetical protein [Brenneria goodwinii]|uniref:Uncharacterized protein n=1 Tax=Brenneria goodwinii TaxID=1109412 RepID=A0A0G4JP16_9GAMM|nr:hypothetical protein [Brenneria goodwinii]CPR13628.1 hypothetical protein BN1221_00024c [Brenneria goodwinii]
MKTIRLLFVLYFIPFLSFSQDTDRDNKVYRSDTFGNFSDAAGKALIVNSENDKVQVSGYKIDSDMSRYVNRDHVGFYISMRGPQDQIITKGGQVKYEMNGFYYNDFYEINKIKRNMFVSTRTVPKFSARITDIDYKKKFIRVSGWFADGNSSMGQIPPQGAVSIINAADKIWGQNTNVYIDKKSTAKTATGYELGVISDGSHGYPIWGFHAVNISNAGEPFSQAFRATGKWNVGYFSSSDVTNSFVAQEPKGAGIVIVNDKNESWAGGGLRLSSMYENKKAYLVSSDINNKKIFYIKPDGTHNIDRHLILKTAKTTSLNPYGPSVVICNNRKPITLYLPNIPNLDGLSIEIKAINSGNVTVKSTDDNFTIQKNTGTYIKLINVSGRWVKLFQSN